MMKRMPKLLALLLCLTMLFALTACGGGGNAPAEADKPEGDAVPAGQAEAPAEPAEKEGPTTLTYGADAEMAGINPFDTQNQSGQSIAEAIYDRLLEPMDGGEYIPSLATDYVWEDDNTLVFHLREGVKFQDGSDFTAEDALVSIATYASNPGQASRFTKVKFDESSCDGDYTLVIKTDGYYAPLVDNICRSFIADKDWIENTEDMAHSANGTGPYMLKEWNMGTDLVLEKNPNYWNAENEPYYDTIDVRFFTDPTTAFLEFESGNLDIVYVQNQEDIEIMQAGGVDGAYLAGVNINAVTALNMSQLIEDSPYTNENLRKAIAYAIDWETMIGSICGGTVQIANSILPSGDTNHVDIGLYDFDPEAAAEYLAKYKEEEGIDGDVQLTIVVAEKDYNVALCEAMQAYLADVGITLNVESGQLFDIFPRMMNGEVMITINQLAGGGSSHNTFMSMEPGCNNLVAEYTDEAICDLIVKATETKDAAEQAAMYEQIQQLNYDGCWAIPMYEGLHFFAAKNSVQGITLNPPDYPLHLQALYAAE